MRNLKARTRPEQLPGDAPELGACLRALRSERGWSLAEVAAKTGIATSTLSRLENNQLSLTYQKLLQLCRGLDVDLSELFAMGQTTPPQSPTGRRAVTPPKGGRLAQVGKYSYRYLCTEFAHKKMTPIMGVITARSIDEVGGFLKHEGEEFLYVLDGILEIHTEFYEPLVLEAGSAIYFDSGMGHAFVSIGDGPVTMLSVSTVPGKDFPVLAK